MRGRGMSVRRAGASLVIWALVSACLVAVAGAAQAVSEPAPPVVTTLLPGGVGNGGPATSALVNATAVVAEPGGTYLFADATSHEIRRLDPGTGTVTAVYGTGTAITSALAATRGDVDAVTSSLPAFGQLWLAADGTLYGTSTSNFSFGGGDLYSIDPSTHVMHLVYGNTQGSGFHWTPVFVRHDGTVLVDVHVTSLTIGTPDTDEVWSIAPGAPAGTHTVLLPHSTQLFAEAPDGTLYEAGYNGDSIRRVNGDGTETLVAGAPLGSAPDPTADGIPVLGAQMGVASLAAGAGGRLLYLDVDSPNMYRLRTAVVGGLVSTVRKQSPPPSYICAGPALLTGTVALQACGQLLSFALNGSQAATGGTVLAGVPDTTTSSAAPGTAATFWTERAKSAAIDPLTGDALVASDDSVLRIHGSGPNAPVTRVAGDPAAAGGTGDGGPATAAGLRIPTLAYAPDGTLFIEDSVTPFTPSPSVIREVSTSGTITTVGGGGTTPLADGLAARAAELTGGSLAVDGSGHLYYGGNNGHGYVVFELDLATSTWHLVVGQGQVEEGNGVTAANAYLDSPPLVAVRPSDGALLVSSSNHVYAVTGGVLHTIGTHGSEVAALGADAAGDIYTLEADYSGPFGVFRTPASGGAPTLVLGKTGPATVGWSGTLAAPIAVGLDGSVVVADTSGATAALLKAPGAAGPWVGGTPTFSVTRPSAPGGPLTLTMTRPAGTGAWEVRVAVSVGTVAPVAPTLGQLVVDDPLTTDAPVVLPVDALLGTCAGGVSCVLPWVSGTTYSFTMFSYPDGSPASVPSASSTVTMPTGPLDAFTPLTPARVLDTRTGVGLAGAKPAVVAAGHVVSLHVRGVGGVGSDADAVVLNVTAVHATADTYVSVYPGNLATPPTVSNINVAKGRTTPNLVTVKVAPDGTVRLYNAKGSVDLVADVTGYYSAGGADTYTPLAPTRILDTRTGLGAAKAALGMGGTLDLQVTGAAGVPAGAGAVVLNVTGTGATASTFVQAYPTPAAPGPPPSTSNLNVVPGQAVANLVTVSVSASGQVRLRNNTGLIDLVADVAGYYSTDPAGSLFTPVTPTRLLDTRSHLGEAVGQTGRVGTGGLVDLQVTGRAGVPAGATAVLFNYTGVAPTASTYIQAYPTPASGSAVPTVSSANVPPAGVVANLVAVTIGAGGRVRLRNAFGTIDLLADIAGYFTGPAAVDHGTAPPAPPVR